MVGDGVACARAKRKRRRRRRERGERRWLVMVLWDAAHTARGASAAAQVLHGCGCSWQSSAQQWTRHGNHVSPVNIAVESIILKSQSTLNFPSTPPP